MCPGSQRFCVYRAAVSWPVAVTRGARQQSSCVVSSIVDLIRFGVREGFGQAGISTKRQGRAPDATFRGLGTPPRLWIRRRTGLDARVASLLQWRRSISV